MGHELTLTETLMTQHPSLEVPLGGGCWEVGRLVLLPEYRTDVDALRHCLHIALQYACAHTQVDSLHATCTHVLSRLYRRFGFVAFARDVLLLGTEKTYTLIQGSSPRVLTALSGAKPS